MLILVRILVQAGVLAIALNLIAALTGNADLPVLQIVLFWAGAGKFVVVSLAAAAVANQRPAFLAAVAIVTIVVLAGTDADFIRLSVSALAGVGLGVAIRALVLEGVPDEIPG